MKTWRTAPWPRRAMATLARDQASHSTSAKLRTRANRARRRWMQAIARGGSVQDHRRQPAGRGRPRAGRFLRGGVGALVVLMLGVLIPVLTPLPGTPALAAPTVT